MDVVIRPLGPADRPATASLLDHTVGAGFWSFEDADGSLSFVAVAEAGVAGAVLAGLDLAGDPDVASAMGPHAKLLAEDRVLHVRELAVAREARRTGLASRLLGRAETEACALGAVATFAFGWLPAGRGEPDSVPFYAAAGYVARPDIPDFFAERSVESGARCPYCGDPPCRCAVRPFVKALAPA
jgi:GNAT superfamily N-acetyltransferase